MNLNIAYIGGGSKSWARIFMNDLALTKNLSGDITLYDIDHDATRRNQAIGEAINRHPKTKSQFRYHVTSTIEEALKGADFVIISILPGTFHTMAIDVHQPEKYGIWQPVGDTTGPGGVLRSMRTVPIFEFFARKISEVCPDAWVINLTNPLAICVKTLQDVFPAMKVFGCCHEVFNAQNFLTKVVEAELGIKIDRKQLYTDVSGINHFTWITKATYRQMDVLGMIPKFMETHFDIGINADGKVDEYKRNPMKSANRVKMDLFRKFGVLGGAGDRHLAEFIDPDCYTSSPDKVRSWSFALTPVDYRIKKQNLLIADSIKIASGLKRPVLKKSNEEAIDLMLALIGEKSLVSNVNVANRGQIPYLRQGAIVETNAYFSNNTVTPLVTLPVPDVVKNMIGRHVDLMEMLYEGIKSRDLDLIFRAFRLQPQCLALSEEKAKKLFCEMVLGTREYLDPFYELSRMSVD